MKLAADFDPATREQWLRLVDGVLKGAPFAKLVTSTYDGIEIQPLYTRADERAPTGLPGQAPFVRSGRPQATLLGWDVRARHADPDAALTNRAILDDLERGATSLWLRVGGDGIAPAELGRVLEGVLLDLAPVVLDAGADAEAAVAALEGIWDERQAPASTTAGGLGLDPFHQPQSLSYAIATARRMARERPQVVALVASGAALHERGASDAQELGAAVAAGVEYVRSLTAAGLAIDDALSQIEFRFVASADQFATIAKLRAARLMWSRVTAACGGAAAMRQHAVSSASMMSRRDPWVNLLRTTVACFAAATGGADAITVLPFDHAIGLPDALGRRLARNTQALLADESNLARVIDPGGGSWYIEALTDELAGRSWQFFQRIEAAGGYASAQQLVADAVAASREARERNLARRKDPLTGVSEFPDAGEVALARSGHDTQPEFRYAEMFEVLRDRADAAATRPRIFSANLGPVAVHTARATFAKNFFEVAGIEVIAGGGASDERELADQFAASGARAAVLCSSDKVYDERATAAVQALRGAGAEHVYLAGNPGEARARYREAGVDDFVFIGCDVRAVLSTALDAMGVR